MSRRLTFERIDNIWYIKLANWIGPKRNLMMVAGADTQLDKLTEAFSNHTGDCELSMNVETWETAEDGIYSSDLIVFEKENSSLLGGANYKCIHNEHDNLYVDKMWLCPVTLFVYQQYPKYFVIEITPTEVVEK